MNALLGDQAWVPDLYRPTECDGLAAEECQICGTPVMRLYFGNCERCDNEASERNLGEVEDDDAHC